MESPWQPPSDSSQRMGSKLATLRVSSFQQRFLSTVLTLLPEQPPIPFTDAQLSETFPEGNPEGVHCGTVLCWQQQWHITLSTNLLRVPKNCIRKASHEICLVSYPRLSPYQLLTQNQIPALNGDIS